MAIDVEKIIQLQADALAAWQEGVCIQARGFMELVELNHSYNFQLWYEEDKARRDDMGSDYVYHAKRNIDSFNQLRNNMIEAMDVSLFEQLEPVEPGLAPVNSETPGMIIDRLSILALKQYHMRRQTLRQNVEERHRQECAQKLAVIELQLIQLSQCLSELLEQITAKTRTFRLYHQFKMYNDPSLNPQLYENA